MDLRGVEVMIVLLRRVGRAQVFIICRGICGVLHACSCEGVVVPVIVRLALIVCGIVVHDDGWTGEAFYRLFCCFGDAIPIFICRANYGFRFREVNRFTPFFRVAFVGGILVVRGVFSFIATRVVGDLIRFFRPCFRGFLLDIVLERWREEVNVSNLFYFYVLA